MRSLSVLLYAFALLLLIGLGTQPSEAWVHGVAPGAVNAPVLQNADINVGNSTRTGRGGAAINSTDFTTTAVQPQTFYGVDIWAGGNPAVSYTRTCVSGTIRTCADWDAPAADTPIATAFTPVPTSTGQNNLAGNYSFSVTAKDAGGNVSNTATLTVHIVNPGGGGACSYGTLDHGDFGVCPSGFGGSPGGYILISTGSNFNQINLRFQTAFTNQVIVQYADLAKPAGALGILVSMSNTKTQHFRFSGNIGTINCVVCSGTSGNPTPSNITFDDIHGYYSPALIGNNTSQAWYSAPSCTAGCGMSNSGVSYIDNGFQASPGSVATVSKSYVWHFYNNAIVVDNPGPWAFNDVMTIAPMTHDSEHTDTMQNQDGASNDAMTAHHFLAATADGTDQAQGMYFGGATMAGTGYLSSGAGVTTPGNVWTFVTGSLLTQSNGSHVFSTSGSPMAIANNAILSCAGGNNCNGETTATLSVSGSLGSPGSPVKIYSVQGLNNSMVGVINTGATFHGMYISGTHVTWLLDHFAYIQDNPNPFYAPTFNMTISGSVMTITTAPVSNIPGEPVFIGNGQRINYSGCAYCGPAILSGISVNPDFTGTYQLNSSPGNIASPVAASASAGYPVTGAMGGFQNGCTNPDIYDGTATLSNGFFQGAYQTTGSFTGCPAVNTTLTHVFNNTLTTADFLNGMLPQTALGLINHSLYTDPPTILALTCNAILPKPGGQLDNGAGGWYWPVTSTGEWTDDGTIIPGCGIH